jgi:hypothetical protein
VGTLRGGEDLKRLPLWGIFAIAFTVGLACCFLIPFQSESITKIPLPDGRTWYWYSNQKIGYIEPEPEVVVYN